MSLPTKTPARSLLHQMVLEHPTELWNDGCEPKTLARAIDQGATGATSNPVLVLEAIEADKERWTGHARALAQAFPTETEDDLAWRVVREAAGAAADLLLPIFEASSGARGRLSLQVSPRLWPNAQAMIEQGVAFAKLRPNMAVKVPAVPAGIDAIEELTALGIPVNATVLFTLPQALAVAEAMERGLDRAARSGAPPFTPWVTIMVGRLDDHLRDDVKARAVPIDVELVRHASTLVMRKAYRIFRERGYRSKLLAAAMRSHHHWSEFIGGSVVVTIPPSWQEKFNASGVEVRARMDDAVEARIEKELEDKLPDFRRAYAEDGLAPSEFVAFGATTKTLHQFLGGYDKLLAFVRDAMLPRTLVG